MNTNKQFVNNVIADLIQPQKLMSSSNSDDKKTMMQSNKDFKHKMQEYDEGLHHDFISLFLGVFGNDHFNSRFFYFLFRYMQIWLMKINPRKMMIIKSDLLFIKKNSFSWIN